MNTVGATRPRCGWFQRISASAPVISPLGACTLGWYSRCSWPSARARRRSRSRSNWSRAPLTMRGSKKQCVAPPPLLARAHRRLGVGDQVLHRPVLRIHGDADRARDRGLVAVHLARLADLALHPLGEGDRVLLARVAADQHQELVAAEVRHPVVGPGEALQPGRDLAQHQVAHVMAERLVDRLEAVEVDEEHRHALAAGVGLLHRLRQRAFEHQPVRQARQAVAERAALQLALGATQRPAQARLEDREDQADHQQGDRADRGEQGERRRGDPVGVERAGLRAQPGGAGDELLAHDQGGAEHQRRGHLPGHGRRLAAVAAAEEGAERHHAAAAGARHTRRPAPAPASRCRAAGRAH